MDGSGDFLSGFLDLSIEIGEPLNLEEPEQCPRCGFDTVFTFPAHLISPRGITVLPPCRACMRCFEETGDLDASIVEDPRPCECCAQGLHSLCLVEAFPDVDYACGCANNGHPV